MTDPAGVNDPRPAAGPLEPHGLPVQSQDPSSPGTRAPLRVAWPVAASLAFSAVFIARSAFALNGSLAFTLFDDAMVSMRYARNLVEGHGLVWTSHGPPVEGYSNLLWTLWMAVFHVLGLGEARVSLGVMLSGAAILAAQTALSALLARELVNREDAAAPSLAAWLTALCYPLVFWTLRGMEVGLMALLISGQAALALGLARAWRTRRLWALAGVMAATLLTRDDGLVACGVVTAFVVWVAPARERVRAAVLLGGAVALTFGLHAALRVALYGQTLPNTYFLKVEGIAPGVRILWGLKMLALVMLLHLAVPVALVLLHVRRRPSQPRGVWLLLALFGIYCAYSAYVGGDAWEWMLYANRFIAPVLPCLLIVVALLVSGETGPGSSPATPRGARLVLAACVWLTMNGWAVGNWVQGNAAHLDDDIRNTRYAVGLRSATGAQASLAVVTAGALGYYSERPCIDLLGKADPHIAHGPARIEYYRAGHNKWDYRYSIAELRPDVVAQLWRLDDAELALIEAAGYERLAPAVFVRRDSPHVDRAALAALVREYPQPLQEGEP
jgi:hypothetical protein